MKVITLIIFGLFIFEGCHREPAIVNFKKAQVFQENGDYEKANDYLELVLKEKPSYRTAYLELGANKGALGDYIGAIVEYKKVIDLDSDNTLAYSNIANNYHNLGELEKALEFYKKALDHSDRDRGLLRVDMPRPANTLMEFDSDFQLAGHEINLSIALIEFDLGNYEESKSRITDPLNRGFGTAFCNLLYAKCLINQDSISVSCSFLDVSRRLDNDEAHLLYARHCMNED